MTNTITIHTDGSCHTQSGSGGYAAILKFGEHQREIHGHAEETTVNQMELTAVIKGLSAIKKLNQTVEIFSDSKYVINGITEWMPDWIKNGWQTKKKEAVKNRDLWQELNILIKKHDVTFTWIKRDENAEADALAQAARKQEIAEQTDERSIQTEHHLLIAGSRNATAEMMHYARRIVQRAHEKGYTILVGDNPKGIDNAVVQEIRRLKAKAVVYGISNYPRNGGVGPGQYVKVTSDLYQAMNGSRYDRYHARDRYMVDLAHTGIFIWDGDSKGTKAGHDYMQSRKKEAHLKTF